MNFSDSPALILGLVVGVGLLPYVAVMATSFAKLVIVFSLLRNALGLQQTPPNLVINGLALIFSIYIFQPVGMEMTEIAEKAMSGRNPPKELNQYLALANQVKEPMVNFLIKHSSDRERALFKRTAQQLMPEAKRANVTDRDLMVVVPAFTVSELTNAFKIGFLIYLPFLIIDLVVSNILLAMGMMMLSPTTVSLPFKLLLFILLDGWSKLIHGLVSTYI
jgi:type III secretion protein R